MAKLTITEALADLKTIDKRIEKKRQFINEHLMRPGVMVDPLLKDGGTPAAIAKEIQGIADLEKRIVAIRVGIQKSNQETVIAVDGDARTIAEWLTWRKEVAPKRQSFLQSMRSAVAANRKNWQVKAAAGEQAYIGSPLEVHVDEIALAKDAERMETILGTLDGLLSLKNATVLIEIAD